MGAIDRPKLNIEALAQILRSRQAEVDRVGKAIANAAGPGFEYVARPHRFTARGYVQTGSARARRAQAIEHRLEASLDAGRGAV